MRAIGLGGVHDQRDFRQNKLPQILVFDEKRSLGDTSDLETRVKCLEEISAYRGVTGSCTTCVEAFNAWMTACEDNAEGLAPFTTFESTFEPKQLMKMSHEGTNYIMSHWGTERYSYGGGGNGIREPGARAIVTTVRVTPE